MYKYQQLLKIEGVPVYATNYWLLIILLFMASFASAQNYNQTSIQSLSNEELLKEATEMFEIPQEAYQRELRIYYKTERDYKEVTQKIKSFRMPSVALKKNSRTATEIEIAIQTVEHSRMLLSVYQEKQQLLEMMDDVLSKLIIQIDATQFVSEKFNRELSLLEPYQFEIKLRLLDQSINASLVPNKLSKQRTESEQQKRSNVQAQLSSKLDEIKQRNRENALLLKETKNAINNIEIQLISDEITYKNEQKNLENETRYLTMSPEKLLMKFVELSEEKNWIESSFEVSYQATKKKIRVSKKRKRELDAIPIVRFDELQKYSDNQRIKAGLDSMLKYNDVRIAKLKELQLDLDAIQAAAKIFEGESIIIDEHVSKMLFIAHILTDLEGEGKIRPDSILSVDWYDQIVKEDQIMAEETLEILTASKQNEKLYTQYEQEINELIDSDSKIKARLSNLLRASKSAQKTKEWEKNYNKLSAKDVVSKFNQLTKDLNFKSEALEACFNTYKSASDTVEIIRRELAVLKDPMYRLVEKEAPEEAYNIESKLYAFIKKKAPQNKKYHLSSIQEPLIVSSSPTETEDELPSIFINEPLDKYQNLLSQYVGLIEKRNKLNAVLKSNLDSLIFHLDIFVLQREEIADLLIQQNICAIKIKKIFSHNQIKRSDIPKEVEGALKYGRISSFESLTLGLFDFRRVVQEELKMFNQEAGENILQQSYIEFKENTSSRVGLHRQLQQLQFGFETKDEDPESTAFKINEQLAINRQNDENTISDFFLGFVTSASSETSGYSDLLKASYVNVLRQERKRNILKVQVRKLERLIKLENSENTNLPELIVLLKEKHEALELEYTEEWIKIKAALIPKKSNEILNAYEARTGKRLFAVSIGNTLNQDSVIQHATSLLFEDYVQIAAIEHWIDLFETRLEPEGIGREIDEYHDVIREIDARQAILKSNIEEYVGHEAGVLEKMDIEDRPQSRLGLLKFNHGKIGALRATRNQLRSNALIYITFKFFFIYMFAFFCIKAIRVIMAAITAANEKVKKKKKKEKDSKIVFILSKITRIFKPKLYEKNNLGWYRNPESYPIVSFIASALIVLIWFIAITLSLDTLGFNVAGILAGLGLGGFAIAFAMKDIFTEVFGGLTLMTSKILKVGQWIMFNGEWAEVEAIGVRYSKLKKWRDGYTINVPNSLLTASEIASVFSNPTWIVTDDLELSIQNDATKIQRGLKILEEILEEKTEDIRIDWVKHAGFRDYSYIVALRYIIKDHNKRNEIQTDVNQEIMTRFENEGILFTKPPQLT